MRRHVLHFLSPKYISTVCFRLFCALCTKSTQKTPIYSMHSEAKCGLENQFINFFSKWMLPVCIELEIYLMTLLWLKCIQRCIELEIYLITLLWQNIYTYMLHVQEDDGNARHINRVLSPQLMYTNRYMNSSTLYCTWGSLSYRSYH